MWRSESGVFERRYAGPGPAFCGALDAWVLVAEGLPQVSEDRAGTKRRRTAEAQAQAESERERAEKERERTEKERERARRIELEERVSALEARLDPAKHG